MTQGEEAEWGNRDADWIGERMAYGYQYGVNQTAQKKGGFSFDLADFGKEIFVGAVTGGLASAAFYGAGKAAILEVTIPKSMYNQLNHMNLDTPYFKSGTTIVEPDLLDAFNKSISNIKHVY